MIEKYICEKCSKEFNNMNECFIHEQSCGENKIIVAELFSITQTHDENARRWRVFKKTVPIPQTQVDGILKLVTVRDLIDYFSELDIYQEFDDIWYDEILRGCELEDENIEETLVNDEDYYHNGEAIFELQVKGAHGDIDRAYISIFEMDSEELKFQDNVDIVLDKYLSFNK